MFLDILQKATDDTDGDGEIDTWGFIDQNPTQIVYNILLSNGIDYAMESNGEFEYGLNKPAAKEAFQFIFELYNVDKVMRNFTPPGYSDYLEKVFKKGSAAFTDYLSNTDDFKTEYGKV